MCRYLVRYDYHMFMLTYPERLAAAALTIARANLHLVGFDAENTRDTSAHDWNDAIDVVRAKRDKLPELGTNPSPTRVNRVRANGRVYSVAIHVLSMARIRQHGI